MKGLEKLDSSVSQRSERLARGMTRRQAVFRFMRGTGGALAAISVGGLATAAAAYADCPCGPTPSCGSKYGRSCPDGSTGRYCPTGFSRCERAACGSSCPYTDGQWTCGPCGPGRYSYYVCTDCRPSTSSCSHCTCRSQCFCTGCNTPSQVAADMEQRGMTPTVAVHG